MVSGEISTIYKRGGKTRKVHHVILLPGLEAAEALSLRLEAIGNLHSDGRPILGLDSRDLLEITLDCCPQAIFIPAHIWTPHFSLFGAFSDFSTLEECYGDLSGHIHALETGLSSDPPMNRRLSMLDRYLLVSNSDAHSPAKLAARPTCWKARFPTPRCGARWKPARACTAPSNFTRRRASTIWTAIGAASAAWSPPKRRRWAALPRLRTGAHRRRAQPRGAAGRPRRARAPAQAL